MRMFSATPAARSVDIPIVHRRRRDPLFIVGHGRSGTSIATTLVRTHLRVAFATESQFFIRVYRRLAKYGDLSVDANRRLLVTDLGRERFFRRSAKYGLQLDVERVVREANPPTYAGVLAAIFTHLAESQQMERW